MGAALACKPRASNTNGLRLDALRARRRCVSRVVTAAGGCDNGTCAPCVVGTSGGDTPSVSGLASSGPMTGPPSLGSGRAALVVALADAGRRGFGAGTAMPKSPPTMSKCSALDTEPPRARMYCSLLYSPALRRGAALFGRTRRLRCGMGSEASSTLAVGGTSDGGRGLACQPSLARLIARRPSAADAARGE